MSRAVLLLAIAFVAAALSACGSAAEGDGTRVPSNSAAGAGKSGAGNSADGGSAFSNADGIGSTGTPSTVTDAGTLDPGGNQCVGATQSANPIPVDMYIMLDRSGSMRGKTGSGDSKWDAIRRALTAFIDDPASAGLGVGLQYFPLGVPGVPETCGVDTDCGEAGGSCTNRVCIPSRLATTFSPQLCLSDAECPFPLQGCAPLGVCELDDTMACFGIGAGGCQQQGDCVGLAGECTGFASCVVANYAVPAVAIKALPDNAPALTDSLMSEMPIGLTPTSAALSGALELSTQQATDNPTHRVFTVLATDGLPTPCGDEDPAQTIDVVTGIAAGGLAQTPSIDTYVIGVYSPDDPNPLTVLDNIAAAGGTDKAFIVDATQDVAQQLIDALATIRGGSLDCEFQLPNPPKGAMLDYQQVNVAVSSAGAPLDLLYVGGPDHCDKALYGWYYDVDPMNGGTPTQIRVCDQTCTQFHALPDASVKIELGCATRGPD